MKSLYVLTMMQLKDKANLSFLGSKKQTLFKAIFAILKFLLTVALCYVVLSLCASLNLFSLFNAVPVSVIAIVFLLMMVLATIFATFDLTKKLYFSFDNRILLTLPAKPTTVFLSKLIVVYLNEIMRNITFMIPLFVAFGILNGYSFIYYPWVFICFLFISMIPVLIGALLSLPMMYFFLFFRRYKILKVIVFVLLVGSISYALFRAVIALPSNIDIVGSWGSLFWDIQDFLKKFINTFTYTYQTVLMIVGRKVGLIQHTFTSNTFIYFGRILLVNIVMLALALLINKPLFYKMASKPFEYKKDESLFGKRNIVRIPVESMVKKEERLHIRNSSIIFSSLFILLGMPFAILLLNKIFAAMSTRSLGDNLSMFFVILIALLISLSSNSRMASLYSREGKTGYLVRTMPLSHTPFLLTKLLYNILIGFLSFVGLGIVLIYTSSLALWPCILLTIGMFALYLAHMLWSVEFDIMNPMNDKYLTEDEYVNNPNENKSLFLAFGLSFAYSIFALFIFIEDISTSYQKLLFIGLLLLGYKIYTYATKVKYFYKERCE